MLATFIYIQTSLQHVIMLKGLHRTIQHYVRNTLKTLLATLILLIFCSTTQAKEIQLFNTDVLGSATSKEIRLLQNITSDEIEPLTVMVDPKCSLYVAATVTYPHQVSFEQARETLNRKYKKYEKPSLYEESKMAVWRVEDRRFAISLTQIEDRIQIIYMQFQPNKEIFKNIMKSTGSDAEVIDSKDCE